MGQGQHDTRRLFSTGYISIFVVDIPDEELQNLKPKTKRFRETRQRTRWPGVFSSRNQEKRADTPREVTRSR